jgi:hypothetical protein
MEGKRVLLMEELASEMGWPDMNLFKEMRAGFKLVGNFEPTGIFKPGVTIPSLSEEELTKNTKFLRPAILGRLKNFDNEDLQKELFTEGALQNNFGRSNRETMARRPLRR